MRKNSTIMSSLKDLQLKREDSINHSLMKSSKLLDCQRKFRKKDHIGFFQIKDQIYQNFVHIPHSKSLLDKMLISKSLSNHFIFSALLHDETIQDDLIDKFQRCQVHKKQYLLKENDAASSFFILDKGVLQVQIKGEAKKKLYSGNGFGELALLYSAPRSASIKALKQSYLWYIDQRTFKEFVATITQKRYLQTRNFIENNIFFAFFTKNQKNKIASIAITQKFHSGQQIFKEDQLASSMYIIKSGKVARLIKGYKFGYLNKGDSFEQYAILTKGAFRRQTAIAAEDLQLISFGVNEIESVLGRSLPLILLRNTANKKLLSSPIFSYLHEDFRDRIIDCFRIRKVEKEQVVVYEGIKKKNLIFFVIEGQYSISNKDNQVEIFGAEALDLANRESYYDFELVFKSEGKIAFMTIAQFETTFNCSFENAKDNYKKIDKVLQNHRQERIQCQNILRESNLTDFKILKELGQGHFGVVLLAKETKTDKLYALKSVPKICKGKNITKYLQNEKKVLETVSSPFIVDYFLALEDQYKFHFLMQFINGIELFTAIREMGLLSTKSAQFYAAIIIHSIQTLHSKSIIYRDLKPENIMVCRDGYLKLIDMGTCKILQNQAQRTCTIIGTPCYMAPQVFSGKGYGTMVDIWSFGIILFELVCGYLPFGEDSDDPYEIFQQILKNELVFPDYVKNEQVISFISQLLSKKPQNRQSGEHESLRSHEFFEGMQWHDLLQKKIKPPFQIPEQLL